VGRGEGRGDISSVNETNKREGGNMKLVWKRLGGWYTN